jgi:hypothetical protein
MDVVLLSEIYLKLHEKFFIPDYLFYRTDRFPVRKGGTAFAVRKGIHHNHVYLPPLVSIETIGVCTPIANTDVLLTAVYKTPGNARNETDITITITHVDEPF